LLNRSVLFHMPRGANDPVINSETIPPYVSAHPS
jgi:hypothetical protein